MKKKLEELSSIQERLRRSLTKSGKGKRGLANPITIVEVQSSNIACIGYHDTIRTLGVAFHSGRIYHYPNTSKVHFHEMEFASEQGDSVGAYFSKHIRQLKADRIQ